MTVFKQYKHSVDLNATESVKISTMNEAVIKLEQRLTKHGWPVSRMWVLLWVSNRSVNVDQEPHEKPLWVGRWELQEHAPLIGVRVLVAVEEKRTHE